MADLSKLSRKQQFYAGMAGEAESVPEPVTIEEQWLKKIYENGGGGSSVQSDWNETDDTAADYIKNKPTLGTAAAKDSTNAVTANSTDLVESGAVKTAIDNALMNVYKPAGDITCAGLTSALLIAANLGNVYNTTDSGTTTNDFVGGAGKAINVGDNIVVVDVGTSENPTYKFDDLAGLVDFTAYQQKTMSSSVTIGAETETTVEGAISEIASVIPSGAASGNKLSTASDTASEEISATATGASITLTDSADGNVQDISIKGYSEVISGEIVSVGDNGLTVTTNSKNLFTGLRVGVSINPSTGAFGEWAVAATSDYIPVEPGYYTFSGLISDLTNLVCFYDADKQKLDLSTSTGTTRVINNVNAKYIAVSQYQSENIADLVAAAKIQLEKGQTATAYVPNAPTTAAITTGLPLRSASDSVYDEITDGNVITRCEVVSDEVVAKATPTVTALSAAEKNALAALKTYNSVTNISATDNPVMTVDYLLNTNNGQAVAKVDSKIPTVFDTTATVAAASWAGASAPYTQAVNVAGVLATDKPIIDVVVSSTVATGIDEIADFAKITKAETGAGTITFSCYEEKPTNDLTVAVKVVR